MGTNVCTALKPQSKVSIFLSLAVAKVSATSKLEGEEEARPPACLPAACRAKFSPVTPELCSR